MKIGYTERVFVKKRTYHDSAFLMRLARELQDIEGITEAVVLMGTEMNRALVLQAGFAEEFLADATPVDMIVALRGEDENCLETAEDRLEKALSGTVPSGNETCCPGEAKPGSLREALAKNPKANIVSIAVPGRYAAYPAMQALEAGLHVFLFSDNVSIEDEKGLKKRGLEKGLLVMGPDCGTSIISGVGLGFSNRVERGDIGVAGPSGTGIQEITCGIAGRGKGVSHAIGTGGRDLSDEAGGAMTMAALRLLEDDPGTKVCVLVAKHPHPEVARVMHGFLMSMKKPVVVRYLGDPEMDERDGVIYSPDLDHAVAAACALTDGSAVPDVNAGSEISGNIEDLKKSGVDPGSRLLGLFGGGSLASEAALILTRSGIPVEIPERYIPPEAPFGGKGNLVIDLGDDHYTAGRPHPMIDQQVRCDMIRAAGADPDVGVILFDLVVGDGANKDPAPELAAAFREATANRSVAKPLVAIASVSGTAMDPQDADRQRSVLANAGVFVQPTATLAARTAADFLGWLGRKAGQRSGTRIGQADESRGNGQAGRKDAFEDNDAYAMVFPAEGRTLLSSGPNVVHLGVFEVAAGVRAASAPLTEVSFQPPASGDEKKIRMLMQLNSGSLAKTVADANQKALKGFLASQPNLVGVGTARDVIPGMEPNLFLHAGPPIEWERASGPLRGAIIGGALLEGLAKTPEEAEKMAASGAIRLEPCHHHDAVGPMAGLITSSMPVWIVEDAERETSRTFCTLNEGLGKVLRYGAFSPDVVEKLRFMERVLTPLLAEALKEKGPIDLKLMMAQALQMGDEGHNRNRAGTSLLFRELAPVMARLDRPRDEISRALSFIDGNDHFFLNLTMPMAKCMLKAAEGIPFSSMVTVMARNGTEFGIRVSGLGDQWFVGPAQVVDGLFFPGYSQDDANPDIGDSAIMETAGLGGFAMAASPAIVQFVGGNVADALATTRRMYKITMGRNEMWALPPLDFAGAPAGLDLLLMIESDILPAINTGIAHKEPGVGQVGAGLVEPPQECFDKAFEAFFEMYGHNKNT